MVITYNVEKVAPSADIEYNDKMQREIQEERTYLEQTVEDQYNYLTGTYAKFINIYNTNPENLTPNQIAVVESLKQLTALRNYNKHNPRNNFKLQLQIIKGIV